MTRKEIKAVKDCAKWLEACLELGWTEQELDQLEDLWWKYHDREGNLK